LAIAQAATRRVAISGFPILYLAMFTAATGNYAMMSLFPAIARVSHIPDALMVAVQSVSAALSIFTTPFWAGRSDLVGRKPVILTGIGGFTLASLLTAGAIFMATHRLVPTVAAVAGLVGARALFGCVGMASFPAIQAHIADETTPADRTRALASIFSANGLGAVVGPALAPFLILPAIGLAGPQAIFAVVGTCIFVAATLGLRAKPVKHMAVRPAALPKLQVLREASVWPFVAYLAVLSGCQAANLQMIGFVVIDTIHLSPVAAQPYSGFVLMAGATTAVTIQLGILRFVRIAPPRMMIGGIGLVILGNIVMAVAASYPAVAIAFVLSSAGYALGVPGTVAGASLANPAARQGTVTGLVSAASSSGLLFAPVLAMILYRQSPATAFVAIAVVLSSLLFRILPRCRRALAGARDRADAPVSTGEVAR
jgi:MFS family permease